MSTTRHRWIVGLRIVCLALALAVTVRVLVVESWRISGTSMREALQDGDQILVLRAGFPAGPPRAGDTVVARIHGETLVKRVAAGPGERIAMVEGRVVRDGRLVVEHIPAALDCRDSFPEVRLGPDEFFLLGDHRAVSVDSREFGPVRAPQILGRVLLRFGGGGISTVAALDRPRAP